MWWGLAIFSIGLFSSGSLRRFKKPVQLFFSIWDYILNMVFAVVKGILLCIVPFREKQRTQQLYGILKGAGLTHVHLWIYAMFSRWHITHH